MTELWLMAQPAHKWKGVLNDHLKKLSKKLKRCGRRWCYMFGPLWPRMGLQGQGLAMKQKKKQLDYFSKQGLKKVGSIWMVFDFCFETGNRKMKRTFRSSWFFANLCTRLYTRSHTVSSLWVCYLAARFLLTKFLFFREQIHDSQWLFNKRWKRNLSMATLAWGSRFS